MTTQIQSTAPKALVDRLIEDKALPEGFSQETLKAEQDRIATLSIEERLKLFQRIVVAVRNEQKDEVRSALKSLATEMASAAVQEFRDKLPELTAAAQEAPRQYPSTFLSRTLSFVVFPFYVFFKGMATSDGDRYPGKVLHFLRLNKVSRWFMDLVGSYGTYKPRTEEEYAAAAARAAEEQRRRDTERAPESREPFTVPEFPAQSLVPIDGKNYALSIDMMRARVDAPNFIAQGRLFGELDWVGLGDVGKRFWLNSLIEKVENDGTSLKLTLKYDPSTGITKRLVDHLAAVYTQWDSLDVNTPNALIADGVPNARLIRTKASLMQRGITESTLLGRIVEFLKKPQTTAVFVKQEQLAPVRGAIAQARQKNQKHTTVATNFTMTKLDAASGTELKAIITAINNNRTAKFKKEHDTWNNRYKVTKKFIAEPKPPALISYDPTVDLQTFSQDVTYSETEAVAAPAGGPAGQPGVTVVQPEAPVGAIAGLPPLDVRDYNGQKIFKAGDKYFALYTSMTSLDIPVFKQMNEKLQSAFAALNKTDIDNPFTMRSENIRLLADGTVEVTCVLQKNLSQPMRTLDTLKEIEAKWDNPTGHAWRVDPLGYTDSGFAEAKRKLLEAGVDKKQLQMLISIFNGNPQELRAIVRLPRSQMEVVRRNMVVNNGRFSMPLGGSVALDTATETILRALVQAINTNVDDYNKSKWPTQFSRTGIPVDWAQFPVTFGGGTVRFEPVGITSAPPSP